MVQGRLARRAESRERTLGAVSHTTMPEAQGRKRHESLVTATKYGGGGLVREHGQLKQIPSPPVTTDGFVSLAHLCLHRKL